MSGSVRFVDSWRLRRTEPVDVTGTRTIVIGPAEELGPVLSGRFEAEELRERIEAELAAGVEVVVSFDGVVAISPSFAD